MSEEIVVEKSEFTKKLEELSGRQFVNDEEAEKHYTYLKDFIGKRKEDFKKELEPELKELLQKEIGKKDEEVKAIKTWITEANIDITKVNPIAIKEFVGEQHADIAPRSVNQSQVRLEKEQQLREAARRGSEDAADELTMMVVERMK